MQIIIPMSGYGERFRKAGYAVPKPLIAVDGKPIIEHVVGMFPGETDFLFICSQAHLDEPTYRMAETLRRIAPDGRIVGIAPHKKGPVWAVLQARRHVKPDSPVFVNYCDFSCFWDWNDFRAFVAETRCAGATPAYKGFHPHSLHDNNYAFIQEIGGWLTDIQEKQPYTDNRMEEYASSGGYYFASGKLCLSAFDEVVERDLSVNGEFYVSLAHKALAQRGELVAVYPLQHFMQWGTPADLKEYLGWSHAFRRLAFSSSRRARQSGSVLVPMAGYGKRFSDAGYALTKALIPVSGRPMVIQAARDLPDAPAIRFVLRQDIPMLDEILAKLRTSFVGASTLVLNQGTEGQAITCALGVEGMDADSPVTIGACDNAMLYEPAAFETAMQDPDVDVLIWVVRGHADGALRPQNFGWVETDDADWVTGVRVKQAPENPGSAPMIVGAFTFKRAGDYLEACRRLVERDGRVNGEFYVDSLIEDAVEMGLRCRLFEIEHYLGWGTPNDYRTFEYWQSCFHKWLGHPYRLELDSRVPQTAVAGLTKAYAAAPVARPRGR